MPRESRKPPADNVLAAVMAHHWAILPESLEQIVAIAERTNLDVEALEKQRGEELKNAYDVTIRDGIATLSATGPLIRYANFFSRVSGATSYEDLARDFNSAIDDPRIKAIVLNVNSPGGTVDGNDELAQMVYAARGTKPIVSYVSHLGASAAYVLAAAADKIVISPTSILGSIGTVATIRKNDANSKTIEVVSTQSPMKRMDPESPEGLAAIQQTVDALGQVIVDRVAQYRGVSVDTVLSDFGRGHVLVGQQAKDAGLADEIGSYEGVLTELRDRVSASSARFPAPRPAGARASHQTGESMEQAAPPAAPATPPAPSAPTPAAAAPSAAAPTPVAAVDLAAVRAEAQKAEQARIAGLNALKKPGNEAMIEQCIADLSCSVETAKARLYDHERATAAAQLSGIKADEAKTAAPKSTPSPANGGDLTPRAAGAAAVELHRSITSSSTRSRKS